MVKIKKNESNTFWQEYAVTAILLPLTGMQMSVAVSYDIQHALNIQMTRLVHS